MGLLEDRMKWSQSFSTENKQTPLNDTGIVSTFDEEDFEKEEEYKDKLRTEAFVRATKKSAIANSVLKIVLIASIFYVLFLIFGVIITEYEYDEKGNVAPVVYSVDEIKEKKEFELLKVYYINIRNLYEDIIVLDYRLGTGTEDFIGLSVEYDSLLDTVNSIVVQMEAYEPPANYRQTYSLMLQLIKTDIAVYLQNVSAAIAQNNEDKANKAILNRETVYNVFVQVTNNIIRLGDTVKGVDISDVSSWSIEEVRKRRVGL